MHPPEMLQKVVGSWGHVPPANYSYSIAGTLRLLLKILHRMISLVLFVIFHFHIHMIN